MKELIGVKVYIVQCKHKGFDSNIEKVCAIKEEAINLCIEMNHKHCGYWNYREYEVE